jgi:hypothetical protein
MPVPLTTLVGWMLVAGAAAIAVRKGLFKPPQEDGQAPPEAQQPSEPRCSPEEWQVWCGAVEELCSAKAWLFDDRLCLLAAGPRALNSGGAAASPRHLIDIAPPEDAALFLSGAASARRGQAAVWECLWQGTKIVVRAISVPPERVLICMQDSPA